MEKLFTFHKNGIRFYVNLCYCIVLDQIKKRKNLMVTYNKQKTRILLQQNLILCRLNEKKQNLIYFIHFIIMYASTYIKTYNSICMLLSNIIHQSMKKILLFNFYHIVVYLITKLFFVAQFTRNIIDKRYFKYSNNKTIKI